VTGEVNRVMGPLLRKMELRARARLDGRIKSIVMGEALKLANDGVCSPEGEGQD
jgi:hypothetical protein